MEQNNNATWNEWIIQRPRAVDPHSRVQMVNTARAQQETSNTQQRPSIKADMIWRRLYPRLYENEVPSLSRFHLDFATKKDYAKSFANLIVKSILDVDYILYYPQDKLWLVFNGNGGLIYRTKETGQKEQLQRLLKQENQSLRGQIRSGDMCDISELDIMQRKVMIMDRLDQNHRVLRYLHEWADRLSHVLPIATGGVGVGVGDDMSDKSTFGISMFHMVLVVMLTICLLFWDSNNIYSDMDIFNSMIEFLYELYLIFHQFIPQSLHVYENMLIRFAQNAVNQTTLLTQNIKLDL